MAGLLGRIRAALSPRFEVESEIGEGGAARVFLARDRSLERSVAVKVLRPERATARAAEAFLGEARVLAQLSHPHVVTIHEVGEEEGLFYYVMDYLGGRSLRDRLEDQGPLSAGEAHRVGTDLLDALEAVHSAGLIHGDVKPDNVFLQKGHAVLGDFGLAGRRPRDGGVRDAERDTPGEAPVSGAPPPLAGTPGYLAPEQAGGEPSDHRADLYAVGLVLYEALTGRRWPAFADPAAAEWTEVGAAFVPALRRALELDPEDRWSDASAFRQALGPAGREMEASFSLPLATIAVVLVVLGGGLWAAYALTQGGDGPPRPTHDLAVLPCEPIRAADSTLAVQISRVAANALENLPKLRTASHHRSFRWWTLQGVQSTDPYADARRTLESRAVTRCILHRSGADSLAVDLEILVAEGDPPPPARIRAAAADAPIRLGNDLALAIVQRVRPDMTLSDQPFDALAGRPAPAVRAFLLGEDAFQRDARCAAGQYYATAVSYDSTFTLARWRLADVRRFLSADRSEQNLRWLEAHSHELGPVDRSLLSAWRHPPGPERLAAYHQALNEHPGDSDVLFAFGDELYHRGPLTGVPPDSARTLLQLAAARDSFLAPAYDHLLMVLIRAGEEEPARRVLDHLRRIKPGGATAGPCALYHPDLLAYAVIERFDPGVAGPARDAMFGPPESGDPEILGPAARFAGPYGDLPVVESVLGRRLRASTRATPEQRVGGIVAEGLGLWSRGRVMEALARFDTAAVLDGGTEGRLHAAEWRVIPVALGLEGVAEDEVAAGRAVLDSLSRRAMSPRWRRRASFALALADARWEPAGGRENELSTSAAQLLGARRMAESGDPAGALERSAPLLSYRDPDADPSPFFRSALHLLRGEWQRSLGQVEEADASWLWHWSVDLSGEPSAFAQRGEVEWALGVWADGRRSVLAGSEGADDRACRLARRVLRHWDQPDPLLVPRLREMVRIQEDRCRR